MRGSICHMPLLIRLTQPAANVPLYTEVQILVIITSSTLRYALTAYDNISYIAT